MDTHKLVHLFHILIVGGLFSVLFPHITVHDELDVSMPETKEGHEAGEELKICRLA